VTSYFTCDWADTGRGPCSGEVSFDEVEDEDGDYVWIHWCEAHDEEEEVVVQKPLIVLV